MKIYRAKNYDKLSEKAASILGAEVISNPECVLGLATGSTPVGAYGYLKKWYRMGLLDFSRVKSMNLDDYKGLEPDNEQGYYYFMRKNLFCDINIKPENTHIPDSMEPDSEKVCSDYERIIEESGGVDLQLLGLGHNGHIGFNEPGEIFEKKCHCVTLAASTVEANKRFFERAEDVPSQAYTMGIGTIMRAKKILLLVSGKEKSGILNQVINGPVTPKVPASVLQFHPNVTIIADEDALSEADLQEEKGRIIYE